MATATQSPAHSEPTHTGPVPYRFTVRQYETMIDAGVFPDPSNVELLGGLIVEQMTKYPPHDYCVDHLAEILRAVLPEGHRVCEEKSVELSENWCPEPDVSVVRGPSDRYRDARPGPDDILLLIEVSECSYSTDSGLKLQGYASAKIPIYWIIDLSRRVVEVHSNPEGWRETASYRDSATFGPGERIPVVIENVEVGKVEFNAFMPGPRSQIIKGGTHVDHDQYP